jgi:hypothetical protein
MLDDPRGDIWDAWFVIMSVVLVVIYATHLMGVEL